MLILNAVALHFLVWWVLVLVCFPPAVKGPRGSTSPIRYKNPYLLLSPCSLTCIFDCRKKSISPTPHSSPPTSFSCRHPFLPESCWCMHYPSSITTASRFLQVLPTMAHCNAESMPWALMGWFLAPEGRTNNNKKEKCTMHPPCPDDHFQLQVTTLFRSCGTSAPVVRHHTEIPTAQVHDTVSGCCQASCDASRTRLPFGSFQRLSPSHIRVFWECLYVFLWRHIPRTFLHDQLLLLSPLVWVHTGRL